MKDLFDFLMDFALKWNFNKRNELYRDAFALWENNQVEMLHEEGNELIIRIASVNLLVSKMRRRNKSGMVHYLEMIREFKDREYTQQFTTKLADELADYMIVEDQFNVEFIDKVFERLEFKLNRLKGRIDKTNEEGKKE